MCDNAKSRVYCQVPGCNKTASLRVQKNPSNSFGLRLTKIRILLPELCICHLINLNASLLNSFNIVRNVFLVCSNGTRPLHQSARMTRGTTKNHYKV